MVSFHFAYFSSLDHQFEAAKVRMTDLYHAISHQFEKPSYWHDKEQSFLSLYGNFVKVLLALFCSCKNPVEYFYTHCFCFLEI